MDGSIRIIMNPEAGKQAAKAALFMLCDRFCAMQDVIQVYVAQHAGRAQKLTKTSEDCCDILVCIGRDSTWNEVISDIMEIDNKPVLAYLPSGTTDSFAVTLELPKSAGELMDTIAQYRSFSRDIGQSNSRYFTYVAALGIFTEISCSTPQNTENSFGKVAYLLESVKQLTNIPRYHVKTVTNQSGVIEDSCIFGYITSSKSATGFTAVNSKGAQLDDEQFELLLIRVPNNPLGVQNIIAALIKYEVNETWMYFRKACDIRMEAREQIPWTLDGENGGNTTLAHILSKSRTVTTLI